MQGNRDRQVYLIVMGIHDPVHMERAGRMALTYGLMIAEYLLAASALCGAARIAVPLPPGWTESELLDTFGVIALATGLLAALTTLTIRLRRNRSQERQRPDWAPMSAASGAAGTGLLWAAIALTVLSIVVLPLFTVSGHA